MGLERGHTLQRRSMEVGLLIRPPAPRPVIRQLARSRLADRRPVPDRPRMAMVPSGRFNFMQLTGQVTQLLHSCPFLEQLPTFIQVVEPVRRGGSMLIKL